MFARLRPLAAPLLATLLFACPPDRTDGPPVDPGPSVEPQILALCDNVWPADECADSECADSDQEAVYFEAFGAWLDGLDTPMSELVGLRRVDTYEAEQSSYTDYAWHVDIGWTRIIQTAGISGQGGDPQVAGIVDELDLYPRLPAIDPDVAMMSFDEAQALLDTCAEELGVTFHPEGWCQPWVPTDPGDDDTGITFSFWSDGDGYAVLDVTGTELMSCRFQGPIGR